MSLVYIVSIVLILFSLYIIVMNWCGELAPLFGRKRGSWVPLVGGLLGALGFAIAPWNELRRLWYVPLLVDWGSLPGVLFTIFYYLVLRGSRKEKGE